MITNLVGITLAVLGGGTEVHTGDCGSAMQDNSIAQFQADYCKASPANYTVENPIDNETIEPSPAVITAESVIVVTEVVTEETEDRTDNGNHYGNDRPDNNDHDVNNPHNGEDTAEEHHNHKP